MHVAPEQVQQRSNTGAPCSATIGDARIASSNPARSASAGRGLLQMLRELRRSDERTWRKAQPWSAYESSASGERLKAAMRDELDSVLPRRARRPRSACGGAHRLTCDVVERQTLAQLGGDSSALSCRRGRAARRRRRGAQRAAIAAYRRRCAHEDAVVLQRPGMAKGLVEIRSATSDTRVSERRRGGQGRRSVDVAPRTRQFLTNAAES